jgi:hypothetical protein
VFPVFNVLAFGAIGNGTDDDTSAIQAALDAARGAGGGIVYLPAGKYLISMGERPQGALSGGPTTVWAALMIGTNTTFKGSGRDATTLLLAPITQPNIGSIIFNFNRNVGGDTNIVFEDFTLDGNAARQPTSSAFNANGITMGKTWGAKFTRVRVQNIKGNDTNGFPTETFCFETQDGADTTYTDCEVLRTASTPLAQTATGFSSDAATNVLYVNCIAHDLQGYGFTESGPQGSRQIIYQSCVSYLNARGFNSESSQNVVYTNCVAGGIAATDTQAPNGTLFPFAQGQSLGNRGQGFNVFHGSHIYLSNCVSSGNAQGVLIQGSTLVRITGGGTYGNSGAALIFADASSASETRVKNVDFGSPLGSVEIAGATYPVYGNVFLGPVPSSGTPWNNPLPFDAMFYSAGGRVTQIAVNGTDTFLTTGSFRIPAGGSVTLTYESHPNSAPNVKWFVDP